MLMKQKKAGEGGSAASPISTTHGGSAAALAAVAKAKGVLAGLDAKPQAQVPAQTKAKQERARSGGFCSC